jgi:hypothetical protein
VVKQSCDLEAGIDKNVALFQFIAAICRIIMQPSQRFPSNNSEQKHIITRIFFATYLICRRISCGNPKRKIANVENSVESVQNLEIQALLLCKAVHFSSCASFVHIELFKVYA